MMQATPAFTLRAHPTRFGARPPRDEQTAPPPGKLQHDRRLPAGQELSRPLGSIDMAKRRLNRWLMALTLMVGGLMGTGHYLQAQTQNQVDDLESALGQSFYAVENADGSVSVVLSPFSIPANLLRKTAPASLRVDNLKNGNTVWFGSGVFIRAADGQFYVLTNHHVVDSTLSGETDTIRLHPYRQSGEGLEAQVVMLGNGRYAVDEGSDLALLRVKEADYTPQAYIDVSRIRDMHAHPLDANEPLFSVGNPRGQSDTIMPGMAFDHTLRNRPQDIKYLEACWPGSSGSPVFDMEGSLVGLNRAISIPAGGRCWGVSAESIIERLQDWGIDIGS